MKPPVWRYRSLARPVSVRVVKCLCRRWRFGSESAWPFSSRFLSPLWQQRGSDHIYLLSSPRLASLASCRVMWEEPARRRGGRTGATEGIHLKYYVATAGRGSLATAGSGSRYAMLTFVTVTKFQARVRTGNEHVQVALESKQRPIRRRTRVEHPCIHSDGPMLRHLRLRGTSAGGCGGGGGEENRRET